MEKRDPLELAQLIVRGSYINFSSDKVYGETSSIYRFTNEDISAYFHHLKNKKEVLTVIGSGGQVVNGILAGTKYFDCFDISIFPEYYLHLQLASILALSKEDYLKYYFSSDREELFCDELYEKISLKLSGKYKEFWDNLYMFDDGIDIYESLLFKYDLYFKHNVIEQNPYLHDNNYNKLKSILQTEIIKINTFVTDITKAKFDNKYDLINLSNILPYYFKRSDLSDYMDFLKNNFSLTDTGEIINYFFSMRPEIEKRANYLLQPNGYVEDIGKNKLLVYKK